MGIKLILKVFFPVLAVLLLYFVIYVSIQNSTDGLGLASLSTTSELIYSLFKIAGLVAFTLIGIQVSTGPFMSVWEKLYGSKYYLFHAFSGIFSLVFAFLHPILLFVYLAIVKTSFFNFVSGFTFHVYLGPLALLLMILTVSTATSSVLIKKVAFGRWRYIHFLNYAVFISAFLHSFIIGSDFTASDSPLRVMWISFLIIMILGFIYSRFTRNVLDRYKVSNLSQAHKISQK